MRIKNGNACKVRERKMNKINNSQMAQIQMDRSRGPINGNNKNSRNDRLSQKSIESKWRENYTAGKE